MNLINFDRLWAFLPLVFRSAVDKCTCIWKTSNSFDRSCSGAGAVAPRRENIINMTALHMPSKDMKLLISINEVSVQEPTPRKSFQTAIRGNIDLSILIAPGPTPATGGSLQCGLAPSPPHMPTSPPPSPPHLQFPPQWAQGAPVVPGEGGHGTPGPSLGMLTST